MDELFAATAEHVTARHGAFDLYITAASRDDRVPAEQLVLVRGDVSGGGVLCRVASACVTSTALASIECDCALQLDAALDRINAADRGILIYLADQEGRGHGLTTKVCALANKNRGLDTFAAVEELELDADVRTFDAVAPILGALGTRSVVLLTGNPAKRDAIIYAGVAVERDEALAVTPHSWTRRSMRAKRERGHTVIGQYADDPLGSYP